MKYFNSQFFFLALLFATTTHAQDAKGTWKFEKSSEYFGQLKNVPPPKYTTIEVTDDAAKMTGCVAKLAREKFRFSDTFQPLLKQDVGRAQLDSYLQKTFQFPLASVKEVHTLTSYSDKCDQQIMEFISVDNKLLVPVAGTIFYYYTKSGAPGSAPSSTRASVGALKTSALPFNGDDYISKCAAKIVDKKGVPHTTHKCGPAFFPYAANANSTDPIVKAIGNHNFEKAGASHATDFSPPFAHGMHPVILLFPPMKDVLLVRVDDFDIGAPESRDPMAAVYLSIKNGKIVDQMGAGCNVDAAYVCTDRDGNKRQLTDSGKFQKLK